MADSLPHDELIRRLRAGDEQAAAELVQRFEPAIRRALRFRLVDRRLRPSVDASEVCQSVLLSFFLRVVADEYALDTPEQLTHLLMAMARHKLADRVRRETAGRRDRRRVADVSPDEAGAVDAASSPSRQVAARELLAEVRKRLTPEEWQLVEWRTQGGDWATIADKLGENVSTLRQRLARARRRVEQELGLEVPVEE